MSWMQYQDFIFLSLVLACCWLHKHWKNEWMCGWMHALWRERVWPVNKVLLDVVEREVWILMMLLLVIGLQRIHVNFYTIVSLYGKCGQCHLSSPLQRMWWGLSEISKLICVFLFPFEPSNHLSCGFHSPSFCLFLCILCLDFPVSPDHFCTANVARYSLYVDFRLFWYKSRGLWNFQAMFSNVPGAII